MSHASIPDFSVPLPALPLRAVVPFHADPILAAIDAHEEAWSVLRVAPAGEALTRAARGYAAALAVALATPCATRAGAFCLLRHLRWWLAEEADAASEFALAYGLAQAREADLTLLLGCDGVRRIPLALPLGRLASAPMVRPVPSLNRAVASAGEVLAGLVLIVVGSGLVGLASLL